MKKATVAFANSVFANFDFADFAFAKFAFGSLAFAKFDVVEFVFAEFAVANLAFAHFAFAQFDSAGVRQSLAGVNDINFPLYFTDNGASFARYGANKAINIKKKRMYKHTNAILFFLNCLHAYFLNENVLGSIFFLVARYIPINAPKNAK